MSSKAPVAVAWSLEQLYPELTILSHRDSKLRDRYPQLFGQVSDEDVPIFYVPHTRTFVLPVLDGVGAGLVFDFCPFSGERLPARLDAEWVQEAADRGYPAQYAALGAPETLPEDLRSETWWIEKGL